MNDDELRERLRAMPEPTTTIDVDAVVADARKRRRPKVVGAGVAVGAACLAFLAPVVVPGLRGPDPVTSTLQEQSDAEQAPAAPAPDAPTGVDDSDGGAATPLGPPIAACAAAPIEDDLALGYVLDGDGTGTVSIQNLGSEPVVVAVGDVGVGAIAGDALVWAPQVDPSSATTGTPVTLEPLGSVDLDVDVLPATAPCALPESDSGDGEVVTVDTIVVALAIDGVTGAHPVLPGASAPVAPAP